ncbi:ABC transporter ATP-binding protein [Oceaniferula spumae]|uniref:ABC transporter ATP-binding protein n=1 Tax=Oceaniferula spumae TaxID=2979115 RepID=A0AAT9FMR7_9BACT
MASVTLKNLVKVYPGEGKNEDVKAVKNIDLEIKDGEFMVLVGPSGCAKSTTLRMIAGLEDITEGEIHIGKTLVNHIAPKDRDIAMVFQNYALYPHMSVFDNMAFGLKLQKISKPEIKKRVEAAAEILGLEDLLERKPSALSGGQRQRVAVGRAIVRNPKVFLFDEPLSNLDAKMRVSMRGEITRLHKRLGATMVYVTHDQTEAMTMGDRITVMSEGVIMQVDTPLNLYRKPTNQFVASFIGSPQMNFIKGAVEMVNGELTFTEDGEGGFSLQLPKGRFDPIKKRPVVLGIRPEDMAIGVDGITAELENAEPMGAETYHYLRTLAGTEMVARTTDDSITSDHTYVILEPDKEKLHLFCGDSGETLRRA